jgi:hypothetical protein
MLWKPDLLTFAVVDLLAVVEIPTPFLRWPRRVFKGDGK